MLNSSYESNEKAINMRDLDNVTPLGTNAELSDNVLLENVGYDVSYERDTENVTLTRNSGCTIPLHHSMNPCIKEMSKYKDCISGEIKAHTDRTLNDLLGTVVSSISTELNQDIDHSGKNTCQSTCKDNSQGHFNSMFPGYFIITFRNGSGSNRFWTNMGEY